LKEGFDYGVPISTYDDLTMGEVATIMNGAQVAIEEYQHLLEPCFRRITKA
jgi:hypothetical protein